MTLYVGDGLAVAVDIIDPVHGKSVDYSAGVAVLIDFFAPGKRPATVVSDRTPDRPTVPAIFDPTAGTAGRWIGTVNTSGWMPGKWSYRVTVAGFLSNVEYSTFVLRP